MTSAKASENMEPTSYAAKYVESGDMKLLGVFDTERFEAFPYPGP